MRFCNHSAWAGRSSRGRPPTARIAQALRKLNGFFYDVKHFATYAPYVDAFVMDQPMADLVSRPTVNLEGRFGAKVFSLSNWDAFLVWLTQLETEMTVEHRVGLSQAYPKKP